MIGKLTLVFALLLCGSSCGLAECRIYYITYTEQFTSWTSTNWMPCKTARVISIGGAKPGEVTVIEKQRSFLPNAMYVVPINPNWPDSPPTDAWKWKKSWGE